MSSRPKPQPAKPGAATGRKPGAPAPEKKAPKGPVITPQVLGIVFFIILVVGLIVFYNAVVLKFKNDLAKLESQRNQTQTQISTYESKIKMLQPSKQVNTALREKLRTLDYLFLFNQDSIVPFFEDTLMPIIDSSRMQITADSAIKAEKYTFQINDFMKPFNTLPSSRVFEENATELFAIHYEGEKSGVPSSGPLDTKPPEFLHAYPITLEKFGGTYEDVKKFIEKLQTPKKDILMTVHCVKNESGKNIRYFRTFTEWTISLTVYFMNTEAQASGDNPPDPPGSRTC